MKPQRILCLHGFTSNSQVHAHQMRRLTQRLPEFEFVFGDGPHSVDIAKEMDLNHPTNRAWADYVRQTSDLGSRGWWIAYDKKWENPKTGGYYGLEESLQHLNKLLRATGPVHAIWGFSQGACLASMLCALSEDSQADHPLRTYLPSNLLVPQRGVFFSGFRSRLSLYDPLYETGISIPTLHVMSSNDVVVTTKWSEALRKICSNANLLLHDNGHHVPRSEYDCSTIIQFMRGTSSS